MKKIIKRNLSLEQKYVLNGSVYVPIQDGGGVPCDNCGTLIANKAFVKGMSDDKSYCIGFDCLETFLQNNSLLDGESIEQFEATKKSLPKVKAIRADIEEFLTKNNWLEAFQIKKSLFGKYVDIYYFYHGKEKWNDCWNIKEKFNFDLLIETLTSMPQVDEVNVNTAKSCFKFKLK